MHFFLSVQSFSHPHPNDDCETHNNNDDSSCPLDGWICSVSSLQCHLTMSLFALIKDLRQQCLSVARWLLAVAASLSAVQMAEWNYNFSEMFRFLLVARSELCSNDSSSLSGTKLLLFALTEMHFKLRDICRQNWIYWTSSMCTKTSI